MSDTISSGAGTKGIIAVFQKYALKGNETEGGWYGNPTKVPTITSAEMNLMIDDLIRMQVNATEEVRGLQKGNELKNILGPVSDIKGVTMQKIVDILSGETKAPVAPFRSQHFLPADKESVKKRKEEDIIFNSELALHKAVTKAWGVVEGKGLNKEVGSKQFF